jgi:hypothetical protein
LALVAWLAAPLAINVPLHAGMAQQVRVNRLPDIAFCDEKHDLIAEFTAANHELMKLLSEQTQAVIEEDPDFMRFDELLHMAREKKEQAKYTLIAHLEAHHC